MAIEDALPRIYDAAMDPSVWAGALDAISHHVGSRGASLHVSNFLDPVAYDVTYVSQWWRELSPERVQKYITEHSAAEKPLWEMLVSDVAPQTLTTDEQAFGSMQFIRTRADYQFLQSQLGVYRRMGARLNQTGGWLDTIGFQFAAGDDDISSASISAARQLVPHVARSLEMSQMYRRLSDLYRAVLATLDKVQVGLCVVRPDRTVVLSNAAAKECLADADGLGMGADSRLACSDAGVQRAIDAALEATMLMPDGKVRAPRRVLFVAKQSGRPALLLEISPLSDAYNEIARNFSGAIVTIIDPSRPLQINIERLVEAYRLTAAEKSVCELLIQGLSNADIADVRGVQTDTVKHQIKSIMVKTVTSSRTGLLRLAVQSSPPID